MPTKIRCHNLMFCLFGCMGILIFTSEAGAQISSQNRESVEREYLAAALQGDLTTVNAIFTRHEADPQSQADMELRTRFESRFLFETEELSPNSDNEFINQLVKTYRRYWINALTHHADSELADTQLIEELKTLLRHSGFVGEEESDVYVRTLKAVETSGFHAMNNFSPPLQDLIVWKTEQRQDFDVTLTDSLQVVSVVFMDDFISQGWSHFASLGLSSISGWAGTEELFCVQWAYDLNSENFRVSYLQHEARHFADYRLYPDLDEVSLEYRAKLTELAFAGLTANSLLRQFAVGRNEAGVTAHARANSRVTKDIYRELFKRDLPEEPDPWSLVLSQQANRAARLLMERNTLSLQLKPAAQ